MTVDQLRHIIAQGESDTNNGASDTINPNSDTNNGASGTINGTINANSDTINGVGDTINDNNDTINGTINAASDTINAENVTINATDDTINAENVTLNAEDVTINHENVTLNSGKTYINPIEIVLKLLKDDPYITGSSLAKQLGVSRRNIIRYLNKLQAQGRIIRVGAKKNGHWEVVEQKDMEREQIVFDFLESHGIPYTCYHHPESPTIEVAKQYWHDDGSVHCKNLFFRNHKGNRHYLVCFDCDKDLAIHDLEKMLHQGKLSFASEKRMDKYLGLKPGSVSPFGLINDTDNHVHLFLDENLRNATSLSFHPNDSRGTVVIAREDFERYLQAVGNTYEYLALY